METYRPRPPPLRPPPPPPLLRETPPPLLRPKLPLLPLNPPLLRDMLPLLRGELKLGPLELWRLEPIPKPPLLLLYRLVSASVVEGRLAPMPKPLLLPLQVLPRDSSEDRGVELIPKPPLFPLNDPPPATPGVLVPKLELARSFWPPAKLEASLELKPFPLAIGSESEFPFPPLRLGDACRDPPPRSPDGGALRGESIRGDSLRPPPPPLLEGLDGSILGDSLRDDPPEDIRPESLLLGVSFRDAPPPVDQRGEGDDCRYESVLCVAPPESDVRPLGCSDRDAPVRLPGSPNLCQPPVFDRFVSCEL